MDPLYSKLHAAVVFCLLPWTVAYEIRPVTRPVIMGESPFWCNVTQTVVFVDIIGKLVLRYDPAHPADLKTVSLKGCSGRVSPAVPVDKSDRLLVGVGRTVRLLQVDWGLPGKPPVVRSNVRMTEVEANMPGNRFNDGKADRNGRLWIGTMDDSQTSRRRRRSPGKSKPNKGELFRFDLRVNEEQKYHIDTNLEVADGLGIPNGMVWTEDNKVFYLADSSARVIYRFDYLSEEGRLANRTTAFSFDKWDVPGAPDGLTIDVGGNLWIACVHGGRVIRVDPRTGALLQTIKMNVTNVSAAEWGGPNHDVLYVTSARYQLDDTQLAQEPLAGCMFAITDLGTRGPPSHPYYAVSSAWRLSLPIFVPALVLFLSTTSFSQHSSFVLSQF